MPLSWRSRWVSPTDRRSSSACLLRLERSLPGWSSASRTSATRRRRIHCRSRRRCRAPASALDEISFRNEVLSLRRGSAFPSAAPNRSHIGRDAAPAVRTTRGSRGRRASSLGSQAHRCGRAPNRAGLSSAPGRRIFMLIVISFFDTSLGLEGIVSMANS